MELLGDDRLPRVGAKEWRREAQEGGVLQLDGRWMHGVAEADVDLHADARRRHDCGERHPDALIRLVVADAARAHGRGEEGHAIGLDGRRGDSAEDLDQPLTTRRSRPVQIEIARGAVRGAGPRREEHRALEHEVPCVRGRSQPMQQSLQHELHEQALNILAALAREVAQSSLHGRAEVLRRLRQSSASR